MKSPLLRLFKSLTKEQQDTVQNECYCDELVMLAAIKHIFELTTKLEKVEALLTDEQNINSILESQRPHWAKGFSSASVAAQASFDALIDLHTLLGVGHNQTEAVAKLKELLEQIEDMKTTIIEEGERE